MLLDHLFLTEMDWKERSPVGRALAKHAGKQRFVHFSPINKIGVNAHTQPGIKKAHNDPGGVYFYPVDWVMTSSKEGVRSGLQYGFDRPYWFVAEVQWSKPGFILSQMTWDDLRSVAGRNGWLKNFETFRSLPLNDQARFLPRYTDWDLPGSVFWHYCDAMNTARAIAVQRHTEEPSPSNPAMPHIGWSQSLHGIAYIYDDATSTINNNEPHQLLVIDPSAYRVIDSGVNRLVTAPEKRTFSGWPAYNDAAHWEFWSAGIKELMQRVAINYGGKVIYRKRSSDALHREPTVDFAVDDRSFMVSFSYKHGAEVTIEYRFGRAEGWRTIKAINEMSIDEIVERIDELVTDVMRLKSDLLFDPRIHPNAAMRLTEARLLSHKPDTWTTKISNDSDPPHFVVSSSRRWNALGLDLETTAHTDINRNNASFSLNFFINGKSAYIHTYTYSYEMKVDPQKFEDIDAAMENLLLRFKTSLDMRCDAVAPDRKDFGWRYVPKVPADMFEAFKGWIVLNCGFRLDGKLAEAYATQIAAYEAYPNKDDLHSTIAYVIKDYLR